MSLKVWEKKCKVRRVLWRFLFLPLIWGIFFYPALSPANPEEELTNLAQFSGTTLAKNGNLILAKGSTSGSYISKVIPTPSQVRIMIPSFVVVGRDSDETIALDISADAGKTYKTDCKNGCCYYASRGDFTAGSNLRYRLRFTRAREQGPNTQDSGLQLEGVSVDYRQGSICLVSPNGGDIWRAGRRRKISWRAPDYERKYPIRIEYSLDGGKSYKTIKEKTKNTGAYLWRIPRKLSGKKVIIRVSDALDGSICNTSDKTLEIR